MLLLNNTKPFIELMLTKTVISLGMHPANERCAYNVTTYLIGWEHT